MSFAAKSFYAVKPDEREYFQYERAPATSVSMPALNYQATDRIASLAKPKIRHDTTIREGRDIVDVRCQTRFYSMILGFSRYISDPTYSGVTKAASHARCSSRLSNLSLPMKRHESYQYELPLPRPVPRQALKYHVTPRVTELATPKKLPGLR